VVHQYYQSEVNNEYVIRGNAAILKCSIPSFVAEFVQVIGWQDDQGNSFDPDQDNGIVSETFRKFEKSEPAWAANEELVNVVDVVFERCDIIFSSDHISCITKLTDISFKLIEE